MGSAVAFDSCLPVRGKAKGGCMKATPLHWKERSLLRLGVPGVLVEGAGLAIGSA